MRPELSEIDLSAYLERVGLARKPGPALSDLSELMLAHLGAIPFENLDVRLGRPVLLDGPSLESKLVRGGRGGYCFEQNTLFASVLRSIGLEVATLEARVRPPGVTKILPRTHMTLRVDLGGASWLVDVGFGGEAPMRPVPLTGEAVEDPGGVHRAVEETPGRHVLRRRTDDGWSDLYAFTLEPALAVDFEVANHFTSTHPRSIFVQTLTAQRSTPEARHVLRGRSYTREGDEPLRREGLTDGEVHALLVDTYGLAVDEDEVSRALAGL